MTFETYPRSEGGALVLKLVATTPEAARDFDLYGREKYASCSAALRTIRDDFFSKGDGQSLVAAWEAVRAAESHVAVAKFDLEELRKRWTAAIKTGAMADAETIENAITAAEAKITRLTARVPVLKAEANALRPAASAKLSEQLEAARAETESNAKYSAEFARRNLSRVVSENLALWHGSTLEAEGSAAAKADAKALAEIAPV